jgi:hypothetical protein
MHTSPEWARIASVNQSTALISTKHKGKHAKSPAKHGKFQTNILAGCCSFGGDALWTL